MAKALRRLSNVSFVVRLMLGREVIALLRLSYHPPRTLPFLRRGRNKEAS
jgi:hypothetical protein